MRLIYAESILFNAIRRFSSSTFNKQSCFPKFSIENINIWKNRAKRALNLGISWSQFPNENSNFWVILKIYVKFYFPKRMCEIRKFQKKFQIVDYST